MAIKKIKNSYNNWEEHKDKINALIDGGGGGGGNAVWGNIEGNIYAQSDLVAVLSNKANENSVYTKAQTDTLLENKQNTLTAGDGIVITSNIISTNIINDTLASRTTVWSSQEVKDRFDAISGSARIVVVATMPATPEENTLYYVGTSSPYSIKLQSAGVLYDMGTTEIDLTGYYTKTEIDTMIQNKIDMAGTGLSKAGTTINHSNSIMAQTTSKIGAITFDAQGHITGFTEKHLYLHIIGIKYVNNVNYYGTFNIINDSNLPLTYSYLATYLYSNGFISEEAQYGVLGSDEYMNRYCATTVGGQTTALFMAFNLITGIFSSDGINIKYVYNRTKIRDVSSITGTGTWIKEINNVQIL